MLLTDAVHVSVEALHSSKSPAEGPQTRGANCVHRAHRLRQNHLHQWLFFGLVHPRGTSLCVYQNVCLCLSVCVSVWAVCASVRVLLSVQCVCVRVTVHLCGHNLFTWNPFWAWFRSVSYPLDVAKFTLSNCTCALYNFFQSWAVTSLVWENGL